MPFLSTYIFMLLCYFVTFFDATSVVSSAPRLPCLCACSYAIDSAASSPRHSTHSNLSVLAT